MDQTQRLSLAMVFLHALTYVLVMSMAESTARKLSLDRENPDLREFFRAFDHPVNGDVEMECYPEYEELLCPDETGESPTEHEVPCGGEEKVRHFCSHLLEESPLDTDFHDDSKTGKNAINGCINYVTWGDETRLGCCESHYCTYINEVEPEF